MKIFFAILILLITVIYMWLRNKHNYWKRQKVETASFKTFYGKNRKHVAFIIQDIYKRMKVNNKAYIGVYNFITPALIVKDLDLIKAILITDFETFPDRGFYSNPHHDPLSTNLVRLSGDMWKKMRQKLTPTFTSGKMKMMFPTVSAIGERFIETINDQLENHEAVVEMRDLCARFTTDVIGSVAFGLECNSLKDPLTEFRIKGDKAFYTIHPLMDALASSYPKFFHKLGFKVFTQELIEFYSQIVRQNVEMREKDQIKRNDFLDILIELKNKKEDSDDFCLQMEDVIAQAYVFFIGGFETSSSTMSFALYEMALNPDVQQKARENVSQVLEKFEGEYSYESLNEMNYIKQVVQETLRKHPVAPTGRRVCRSTYTLDGPKAITIQPGVQIIIPVYAIHHDPDYYPDPERFQPERFATSLRDQIHSMAYLPFGAGPRTCIAERFGMMQAMIGVALLLKNFKFSICPRTPKELDFDALNVRVFNVKSGIYLKVERV
ncbi:cytochrome P450 6a8-like [Lucilia sericata]|uniref:cytochrome P450 6a8-like n=1 Tax=Lucilia sericata TaxID=13632 RepID=UPI0018A8390B|nr:cytochrome P450 6a8-like [Lucilia sericata]